MPNAVCRRCGLAIYYCGMSVSHPPLCSTCLREYDDNLDRQDELERKEHREEAGE